MANVNKVILIGNITRDIELKYTPKGTAMTELGLAINRTFTQDGSKKEEVLFVDVTLWGRTAEVASEYAKKGSPIYVEGRLQMDTWEDKQTGQKRSKLRVVGDVLQLLGGRPQGGDDPDQPATRPPARQPARPATPPRTASEPDDDIPF